MTSESSLLGFSKQRSSIEQEIKTLTRHLVVDGSAKSAVVHGIAQVLIDLCLEDDQIAVSEKIEIMRHTGRSLLAIVAEIEDRIGAIERCRAAGLPDTARN